MQNKKQQFIIKSNNIHFNKYDYSKIEYVNNKIKIEIICPIHGDFYQSPSDHLQGCGCPKCGLERTKRKYQK